MLSCVSTSNRSQHQQSTQEKHSAQQQSTGEALRAAAHSSQHASSSIRTWSDTLCLWLRYMQARLFRRRVKCDTGGQCQAANGGCLPAANVQCINIKNAIQTHQIWSGGECQPMSATWSGLFVWMHAPHYNWYGPEISTICIFCKFLWILVIFNKYFVQTGTQSA